MSTPVIIAIAVVIISVILVFVLRTVSPAAPRRTRIVFTGEMGAGKTALLKAIEVKTFPKTVTSFKTSSRAMIAPDMPKIPEIAEWQWVDVPGHGSFASELTALLNEARAIVVVVDCTDTSQWKQIASRLYGVLTHPTVLKAQTPVIVACNKTDLTSFARSPSEIESSIAAALDKLRKVRSSTAAGPALLGDSSSSPAAAAASESLARPGPCSGPGGAFCFADARVPVRFVSASAKAGETWAVTAAIAAGTGHAAD